MKFLSIVFILFLAFNLANCTRVNYNPDDEPRQRGDKGKNTDVSDFNLEDISDLDLSEIETKVKFTREDCKDYESGVPSINIVSDAISKALNVQNPIQSLKNCLAKSIDDSLKPLCDAERSLDDLEKEHRNDDQALDQIDYARDNIENAKDRVIEELYDIADSLDRTYGKNLDKYKKKNRGFVGDVGEFILDTELGSFIDFFESKANSICLGNLSLRK